MLFERFCRDVWSEKVIHRVSKKIYMNKFFAMCMAVALAGGGTAIARQSRSVEPEGSPIAKLTSVSRDNMPVAVTYTAEGNGFKMGGAPLKFTLAELMNSDRKSVV